MIRNPQDIYTKSFLPSRKLRIILVTIVGIAVLVWLIPHAWAWIRTPGKGKALPEPINPSVTTTSDTYLDSDNDGIPDWKEQFIRTYGVVENNEGEGSAASTLELLETIPDTQKVALEIAAQVEQTSPEGASAVTEQAIREYIEQIKSGLQSYTIYNITVGEVDTREVIEVYAKDMQKAGLEINSALEASRIKLVLEAYASSNEKDRVRERVINDVRQAINHLLEISVPPSAVSIHLALVNALYQLHQTLSLPIPIAQTDPVRSYALLLLAQDSIYTIFSTQTNLAGYFFITLDPAMY